MKEKKYVLAVLALMCFLIAAAVPVSAAGKTSYFKNTSAGTFYIENGHIAQGFRMIGNKAYYFHEGSAGNIKAGRMASGLQKIRGNYYYFYPRTTSVYGRGQMAAGFAQVPYSKGSATMYFYPRGNKKFGQAASGWQTIEGKRYYFSPSGILQTGFHVIDGKGYYFAPNGKARGQIQTGWQTTGDRTYYLSTAGEAVRGWQTIDGTTYYFDSNYTLTSRKVNNVVASDECGTMKEKTLWRAEIIVSRITDPSMTKAQKIWACFDYTARNYDAKLYPRTPHYVGSDWPEIYANDMFVYGIGNCCSYAAAFAYLVKACGYEVYCCNSTGHGWAEIDGLIYDPEIYHRQLKTLYFGTPYSALPDYANVRQWWQADPVGNANLHIKI